MPAISASPSPFGRVEAAGEAGERLPADQVRDELGRPDRLDAVVGRDAVTAEDLAAGVGQLGLAAALAAGLAVAGRVVVLEGGLGVVALDRATRRACSSARW